MTRDNAHHIATVMMAKNLPNRSFLLPRFVLTTSLQLLEVRATCTGKEGLHPWTKKSFLLCNCNPIVESVMNTINLAFCSAFEEQVIISKVALSLHVIQESSQLQPHYG